MTYLVQKHNIRKYHRDYITAAFKVLEKYDKFIHKCCREKPKHNTMSADELYSDLILDRVPTYLVNCRLGIERIKAILAADLTPIQDPKYRKHNIKTLSADPKSVSPERLRQWAKMLELERIAADEKKFLAFLRSCIRRTKYSYMQKTSFLQYEHLNGELEQIPKEDHPYNSPEEIESAEHMLLNLKLKKEEVSLLMDILVHGLNFQEAGNKRGYSRQTCARRYQAIMREIRYGTRDFKSKGSLYETSI